MKPSVIIRKDNMGFFMRFNIYDNNWPIWVNDIRYAMKFKSFVEADKFRKQRCLSNCRTIKAEIAASIKIGEEYYGGRRTKNIDK